ncbi:MAG: hypothetical protein K2H43_07145, partial [Clostridia bacterium]|nr:hypothetical protein [Clostridia bacterium]
AEHGGREDILVHYGEIRFFSVCTRRAPRENGEWSVVFEIPVKYLAKKGKAKPNDPPALVQTDGKSRLYACLDRRGFELIGTLPPDKPENRKFVRLRKFVFPDRAARKRALALIVLGGVLIAAAVPAGIFLNVTAGALFGVIGAFLLGRSCASYAGAKSELAFYREGVFWREKNRADSVFLKWEDIVRVSPSEKDGYALLDVTCPYGVYHYPDPVGAEEFLKENFPDKFA